MNVSHGPRKDALGTWTCKRGLLLWKPATAVVTTTMEIKMFSLSTVRKVSSQYLQTHRYDSSCESRHTNVGCPEAPIRRSARISPDISSVKVPFLQREAPGLVFCQTSRSTNMPSHRSSISSSHSSDLFTATTISPDTCSSGQLPSGRDRPATVFSLMWQPVVLWWQAKIRFIEAWINGYKINDVLALDSISSRGGSSQLGRIDIKVLHTKLYESRSAGIAFLRSWRTLNLLHSIVFAFKRAGGTCEAPQEQGKVRIRWTCVGTFFAI